MAWTQSDLDAIDSAIKAKITGGAIASYSIASRSIVSMSMGQLLELRRAIAQEVLSNTEGDFILADLRES